MGSPPARGPSGPRHAAELQRLLRISPETDAVVQTIEVPAGPRGVAVADGSVWVASTGMPAPSPVDATTGDADWTARVGGSPIGIAVGHGAVWTTHSNT